MIKADPQCELQIVATNMHLIERYGYTVREIEKAGFTIDRRVPMEVYGDTDQATVRSMGLAMEGFSEAYAALRPEAIVLLGDRYEMLCAAAAALVFGIPIAHLHGGEITEGAYDDAIRHSITKMSHLHFTSTEEYRRRVIQMGEQPSTVFNVGAIGIDNIRHMELWDKTRTEAELGGFALDRNTILVTYHPVTLEEGGNTPERQIDELLAALDAVSELRILFTMPNSDTGNHVIAERIQQWCEQNAGRAAWFTSLGQLRYFSVLQYIGAVVGNSSSGIIEVPSFGIPTIDIGDRQKGRLAASSVVHCKAKRKAVIEQLSLTLHHGFSANSVNPYEQPETARRILDTLKEVRPSLQKHFYDLPR